MKIIVCNIGSSSFKFQLLDMENEVQIARGYTQRVGSDDATITYWINNVKVFDTVMTIPTHREAVQHALDFLTSSENNVLADLNKIDGVGFKTIQAGEKNGSVMLTPDVLAAMENYKDLAPAHNPPYLTAIYMFRDLLPHTPLVGVFEPGFHVNAPDYAKVYGTPYEWYEKYGVKKYGYHGASHRFITAETVKMLKLPHDKHKIISCHLGGSSSLCAFKDGVAIDTSMGFTPQTGLIQGTRIGDMDPYVLPYIMKKKNITLEAALVECSKNSGLAGLSGVSGDMREINQAIEQSNQRASLAKNKFIYDIKRYIGEFLIMLGGVDAVTITGGIGENNPEIREDILNSLAFMGLEVDHERNISGGPLLTTNNSTIAGLVLETNEEIVVARETVNVIKS